MGVRQRGMLAPGHRTPWIVTLCAVALALAGATPAAAQAPAVTVTLTSISDPASDGSRSVTARAQGEAAADGTLQVRQGSCAGAPAGTALGSTQSVTTGAFDRTFTGTLKGAIELCAYLLEGGGVVATDGVQEPSSLTVDQFRPVTLSGDGEFVRGGWARLYVTFRTTPKRTVQAFTHAGSGPCAATSAAEQVVKDSVVFLRPATSGMNGWFDFIVPDSTSSRVCAYIGEPGDAATDPPVQVLSAPISSARAASPGTLELVPSRSPAVDDLPVTITVQGAVEVPRALTVVASNGGTSCAATPAQEIAERGTITVADRVTVGGGSDGGAYSSRETLRPGSSGRHLLCAYLTPLNSGTPSKTAQRTLDVVEPSGSLAIRLSHHGAVGAASWVEASGTVEAPRRLFIYSGPERECSLAAYDEAHRSGVTPVTGAEGHTVGAGAFSVQYPVSGPGSAPVRVCSYLTEHPDESPIGRADLVFAPSTGTPPGGTPPGTTPPPGVTPPRGTPPAVTPPAGGTPVMPAAIGKTAVGGFWVNNTVMPPGVTAARFVELARSAGERWGYKFRGVTDRGAAKRDRIRVVGFSSVVKPHKHSKVVVFKRKARKPKSCKGAAAKRRKSCRTRYVTVERDVALARRLTTWWDGAGPPPPDRMDVESALLRIFGVLAGNKADAPACTNTPLLRSTGVTAGWYWRSSAEHFRPRCPIT